jgi:hypothetical protein
MNTIALNNMCPKRTSSDSVAGKNRWETKFESILYLMKHANDSHSATGKLESVGGGDGV